jgi:beta-aspartyl-dipeptidase (metallo-type)
LGEATLLTGGHVYCPEDRGIQDILTAGGRIIAVAPDLHSAPWGGVEEVDCKGYSIVPGLVDSHLHIIGGGGNEGYSTRIPELWPGELLTAGITTAVGTPGIDMLTKGPEAILAKAYALAEDGVSTYMYIGGFQTPFRTLTGSVVRDLYLVEKVVGVKVALGERRASAVSDSWLVELARELEWCAGATGKACVLHAHLGDLEEPGRQLLQTIERSNVHIDRFHATHCNNTEATLQDAITLGREGCAVDCNPLLDPARGLERCIPFRVAVGRLLEAGVALGSLTMSSDGNASVPPRDGTSRAPYEKYLTSLWEGVVELVESHVLSLADALTLCTSNVSRILRLESHKGVISVGADADLLIVDGELKITTVYTGGRPAVLGSEPAARGMYEGTSTQLVPPRAKSGD